MFKKYIYIFIFCLCSTLTWAAFKNEKFVEFFKNLPQIITFRFYQKEYFFADEKVPTDKAIVKLMLENEIRINAYLHNTTLQNLKLSKTYFPLIEPILKEYNIPSDFKYLIPVESNFSNSTSGSGAKGFWQFMPPTAEEFGLEITSSIDERLHLQKATQAACKLILKYYEKFNNWTLTAAAYNGGIGRVSSQLEVQNVSSYYDLFLNDETARYIYRIVAIKEILENPTLYGYQEDTDTILDQSINLKSIEINQNILNLVNFAKENNTTYKELRYYNPWIRDQKLIVKPLKIYSIKLPQK